MPTLDGATPVIGAENRVNAEDPPALQPSKCVPRLTRWEQPTTAGRIRAQARLYRVDWTHRTPSGSKEAL